MCQQAHAFRGEYLDLCAQIEHWAMEMIEKADKAKKAPVMFGPRLRRVQEIAGDDLFFDKPKRVLTIMDTLSPFVTLRSNFAHAVVRASEATGDQVFVFEMPGTSPVPFDAGRFWLRASEMKQTLTQLRAIFKHLQDQRLKPVSTPMTAVVKPEPVEVSQHMPVPPKPIPGITAPPDRSPNAGRPSHPPLASDISAPSHS
jgi:hypothetical protein